MNKEIKVAKEAALEAGNLILSFYKADYEIRDKGYHNPVTTADHASDNRIKVSAFVICATLDANLSLSPNFISEVAIVSFSFTTGI